MNLNKVLKKEQQCAAEIQAFNALPDNLKPSFERLCLVSPWLCAWLKHEDDWQNCWQFFSEPTDADHQLPYESDLDLVFLHNASAHGSTEGPKRIENSVLMRRLGQKLIHVLSAITSSGQLYEIDTRLRPSGRSGLQVSSVSAFEKYQLEQAWTWEHQAIVRARFIAGDDTTKDAFDDCRRRVIGLARDEAALRNEVHDMRSKMLVQFLVLMHGSEVPNLADWSDNVRIIGTLQRAGVVSKATQENWLQSYHELRAQMHQVTLAQQSQIIASHNMLEALKSARNEVTKAWHDFVGT